MSSSASYWGELPPSKAKQQQSGITKNDSYYDYEDESHMYPDDSMNAYNMPPAQRHPVRSGRQSSASQTSVLEDMGTEASFHAYSPTLTTFGQPLAPRPQASQIQSQSHIEKEPQVARTYTQSRRQSPKTPDTTADDTKAAERRRQRRGKRANEAASQAQNSGEVSPLIPPGHSPWGTDTNNGYAPPSPTPLPTTRIRTRDRIRDQGGYSDQPLMHGHPTQAALVSRDYTPPFRSPVHSSPPAVHVPIPASIPTSPRPQSISRSVHSPMSERAFSPMPEASELGSIIDLHTEYHHMRDDTQTPRLQSDTEGREYRSPPAASIVSARSVRNVAGGATRKVTVNSPVQSPETKRRSSNAVPRASRKFADSRSPLQKLELTLDSMTKEEKRARMEVAERKARERSNLEIDKLHLARETPTPSMSPAPGPANSSRMVTVGGYSSPLLTTPQGTPNLLRVSQTESSQAAASPVANRVLLKTATPVQSQSMHKSPLVQDSAAGVVQTSTDNVSLHKQNPYGEVVPLEGMHRIASSTSGHSRNANFCDRMVVTALDGAMERSNSRHTQRVTSPEVADILEPQPVTNEPMYHEEDRHHESAVIEDDHHIDHTQIPGSIHSSETYMASPDAPFVPDPILMNPHQPPLPPKRSSSFSFSLSRRNSNKLHKDPPNDPFYRLRVEAEKYEAQKAAAMASASQEAHAIVLRQSSDALSRNMSVHDQVEQRVASPEKSIESPDDLPPDDSKVDEIMTKLQEAGYASDDSGEEPASRSVLKQRRQEHEREEHKHRVSNFIYGETDELKPGAGLYEPPKFLDEWRKGTVGTLSGSLLDLSQTHEQEQQQNMEQTEKQKQSAIEPTADSSRHFSWWEQGQKNMEPPPVITPKPEADPIVTAEAARRRGSLSSRPRKAEAFDGEYIDRKDAPTKFRPQLYLKCGPLLRYTGIRKERLPNRFRNTQAPTSHARDREFWRGTVMIVTQDDESSYEIAPTLRFFVQPIELFQPSDNDPDRKGPYNRVDPIAAHPKVGRRGETLYVRPVSQVDSAKDLSLDETEWGLFETSRTLRDGAEGITEIPGSFHARRKAVSVDGESLGKYKEVRGFRLHAERGLTFWRFNIEVELKETDQRIAYRINRGPATGLWVPAKGTSMNIMFYSCNGFSTSVNPDDFCGPDPMWRDVMCEHQSKPFHVMIGGGDQLYCDSVAKDCKLFEQWLTMKNPLHKHNAPFSCDMQNELESYYLERYCMWYSHGLFGLANSQIPMVNMLDDHDIIDGYGSYPHHAMGSPIFKGLGAVAFKYYMLFQHQSITDETEETEPSWILGTKPGPYIQEHSRSLLVDLGSDVAILAIDGRTERTEFDVISEETWEKILDRCYRDVKAGEIKHLLVLLGVPIAYPRMVWLENILTSRIMDPVKALGRTKKFAGLLNKIDGGVEVLDDLNDHWTAKNHKAERREVIEQLQDVAMIKSVRVTILSGDVHLGGIGQFYSNPKFKIPKHKDFRYMPNVISSAIANAPPPNLLADVLNKRNKVHHFDKDTDENMIPIFTHDVNGAPRNNKHLLPRRNWCSIRPWTPGYTPVPTPAPAPDTVVNQTQPPQRKSSILRRLSNAMPYHRKSVSQVDVSPQRNLVSPTGAPEPDGNIPSATVPVNISRNCRDVISRPPITTTGRTSGIFRSLSQRSGRGRDVVLVDDSHDPVSHSNTNIATTKPKRSLSLTRILGLGGRKKNNRHEQERRYRDNDYSDGSYDDDYESSIDDRPRESERDHGIGPTRELGPFRDAPKKGLTEAQLRAHPPSSYSDSMAQTGPSLLGPQPELDDDSRMYDEYSRPGTRGYSRADTRDYSRTEFRDYSRADSRAYSQADTQDYSQADLRGYSRVESQDCPRDAYPQAGTSMTSVPASGHRGIQQNSLFSSQDSLQGPSDRSASRHGVQSSVRSESPLIQPYRSSKDHDEYSNLDYATAQKLSHSGRTNPTPPSIYTNTIVPYDDYSEDDCSYNSATDDKKPPSSRSRNVHMRGGAVYEEGHPVVASMEFHPGDEAAFTALPMAVNTSTAPDDPAVKPFKRSPTTLTAKQRKNISDYEVDLEGALDICLHMEIDSKDPAGLTVPYRVLVPRLFFSEEDERALEEIEWEREREDGYINDRDGDNDLSPDYDDGDEQAVSQSSVTKRPSAFKRLLSFKRKDRAREEMEERRAREEAERLKYGPDGRRLDEFEDNEEEMRFYDERD